MKFTVFLSSIALAAAFAPLPSAASSEVTDEMVQEVYGKLAEQYSVVDSTAWPLLTTGADLCTVGTAWRTGIRPKAIEVDGDPSPTVFTVAKGSPADLAGVRAGDVVVSVNGDTPRRGFRTTYEEKLDSLFAHESADPVELVVDREGAQQSFTIVPAEVCDLRLTYMPGMDGRFHGESTQDILVTEAFFRAGEEEWQRLAFLAPDLAYAMSETRAANNKLRGLLSKGATFLDKAGVAGGGLLGTAAFGSKFVLNVDQALAADRVSLFLLARLGVDVEQVPDFWRGIYQYAEGDTALDKHFGLRPGLTEREEAFQSAIAEINAKVEAGEPLTPDRS